MDKLHILSAILFFWSGHYLLGVVWAAVYFDSGRTHAKQIIQRMPFGSAWVWGNVFWALHRYFVDIYVNMGSYAKYIKNPHTRHVFIVNHHSHLDFMVMGTLHMYISFFCGGTASLPNICASVELENIPVLGYFIRTGRAFFVKRKKDASPGLSARESINKVMSVPDTLMVFAEGMRSGSYAVHPIKTGVLEEIVRHARETDAQIKVHTVTLSAQGRPDNNELILQELGRKKRAFANVSGLVRVMNTLRSITHQGAYYLRVGDESFTIDGAAFDDDKMQQMFARINAQLHSPVGRVLTDFHLRGVDDADRSHVIDAAKRFGMHYDSGNTYDVQPVHEIEVFLRWNYWLQPYRAAVDADAVPVGDADAVPVGDADAVPVGDAVMSRYCALQFAEISRCRAEARR